MNPLNNFQLQDEQLYYIAPSAFSFRFPKKRKIQSL